MLGRTVAETLLNDGHEVTVVQRRPSGLPCREVRGDLRDRATVEAAVTGQDAVIHLAAKVSPTGSWPDFVAVNVDATRSLLADSKRSDVDRFVYVSSPAVAASGEAHVGLSLIHI